jgi:hypothetical protein
MTTGTLFENLQSNCLNAERTTKEIEEHTSSLTPADALAMLRKFRLLSLRYAQLRLCLGKILVERAPAEIFDLAVRELQLSGLFSDAIKLIDRVSTEYACDNKTWNRILKANCYISLGLPLRAQAILESCAGNCANLDQLASCVITTGVAALEAGDLPEARRELLISTSLYELAGKDHVAQFARLAENWHPVQPITIDDVRIVVYTSAPTRVNNPDFRAPKANM